MAAQRVGGTCYFKRNGVQYSLRGKFEYSLFTSEKEGVVGSDGPHGFIEKPCIPSLKGSFTDLGGVSVTDLQNMESDTLTAELNNGKLVILRDAWVKGKISVNNDDGSYDAEFEGMSAVERTK